MDDEIKYSSTMKYKKKNLMHTHLQSCIKVQHKYLS